MQQRHRRSNGNAPGESMQRAMVCSVRNASDAVRAQTWV